MFMWLVRGRYASLCAASDLSSCSSLLRKVDCQSSDARVRQRTFSHNSVRYGVINVGEPDFAAARKWYTGVGRHPVSENVGEVSYARSSGPGGQNVNKVNSKAQLRVSLDQLLPLLPEVLHHGIRKSVYCVAKSNSILIQSDESRKQAANRDACFRKLNQLIMDIYDKTVPGETSPEQKEKVQKLQRLENEARLQMKKIKSSKKAARQKGRGDN